MHPAQNELPEVNEPVLLKDEVALIPDFGWVTQPTAILVSHGMGNQRPMETLEQFGRTLIQTYKAVLPGAEFIIEHRLEKKSADAGAREWYDDVLRIRKQGDDVNYIDIYEYYWAHQTEGKADWNDINSWIQGIVSGAWKYYGRNMEMAERNGDKSAIVRNRKEKWDLSYYFFLIVVGQLVLLIRLLGRLLRSGLNYIPLIGSAIIALFDSFTGKTAKTVSNIIADLVAYSVTDAKSKYYPVRRAILDGAVNALKYLIEHGLDIDKEGKIIKDDNKQSRRTYQRIIVAGHSLGSQVSYDAINRINLMINHCLVKGYDEKGNCEVVAGNNVSLQLAGLITFGSPLDKTAFFLRENIPADQFVRQQLLNDFLNFKQRDWTPYLSTQNGYFKLQNKATPARLLEQMPWRNYFDRHDYVSGSLDYYCGVRNIDCRFRGNIFSFTHSDYWICPDFYKDIIINFLK